ncbi:hypothetical protein [Nitratidesulfovibrio liaohensis]|uniref:Uncharacterized protein n=1 Tax=Nitratidesulfovibrio liaohensis TaxID=2604158 RepID=A0ABY9R7E2_9BACT|nr:hypothetical protein [Nitratidesulfovibrio liaohensis]WMW66733.1 hypothetical protein KPS_001345 [Nitratidesulfovibrio liaohensis]
MTFPNESVDDTRERDGKCRADGWRLDRRVGVQALTAAATAFAGAVMLAATVQARLDAMEARAAALDGDVRSARETAVCVARMDERLAAVQRALEEMRTDLRHLRAEARVSAVVEKEAR